MKLPDVAAKIGTQLRNQYVLAYAPPKKPKDGKGTGSSSS
jgi:hypothetical protein